jgi:uncharacterized SAM-binding protein YcdF (DUF218 family)
MLLARWRWLCALVCGLIVIDVLFYVNVNYRADQLMTQSQAAEKRDLAVGLFGDFGPNKVGLGPQSQARVQQAVDLYKAGHVSGLLFVGGCRPIKGKNGANEMVAFAVRLGVEAHQVWSDSCSWDTFTNLSETQEFVSKKKIKSVILVSDRFHLSRIDRILKSNPLSVVASLSPTPPQSVWMTWLRVHQEGVAQLSELLPKSVRARLLKVSRD